MNVSESQEIEEETNAVNATVGRKGFVMLGTHSLQECPRINERALGRYGVVYILCLK